MLPRLSLVLVALWALHPRPAAGQYGRSSPTPVRPTASPIPAASALPAATSTPRPTPTPVPPGEVRVKVTVTGPDGKSAPAADAVAWFPGLRGPAPAAPPRMASREKRFEPRVLAVPQGSAVSFPNYDKIFHNVFSLSEAAPFDLGLYRNGAARTTSFETPGVVRVYCNIHPQMAAYVVVLDGNLYAQTGKDGLALVSGVPAGRQNLKVWEERGGEWSGTVVVPAGGTVEITVPFDASKWREQPHKNKHGKNYPPPDDDENRY
jgi:plastocyanin